jgi:hypothetical protein
MKSLKNVSIIVLLIVSLSACSDKTDSERNGFTVNDSSPEEGIANVTGIESDTLSFKSRPNGILLTSDPQRRLVPVYKLNARMRDDDTTYSTGSNCFHTSYSFVQFFLRLLQTRFSTFLAEPGEKIVFRSGFSS